MRPRVFIPFLLSLTFLFAGCATGVPEEEVAQVYYNLGKAYADLDRNNDAIKAYSRALSYDASLFQAGYNLARMYIELGKFDEAEVILRDLLTEDPENTVLLETEAWSYHLQGNPSRALEIYEGILKKVPNHKNALFNAGVLAMEKGDSGRAYELFTDLYGYTPEDEEVLLRLGFLEREQGNPEKAVELLEKCVKKNPENREALLALGEIHVTLARYGDAVTYYDKALELEASSELLFEKAFILLTALEDYDEGMATLAKAVEEGFSDTERVIQLAEYPELYNAQEIIPFLVEKGLYEIPDTTGEPEVE
ncbi:MAG: tetratricopeptide repeat protein [Spirochaetales bacterium]|nr:tetratricopeptide repeat protein [Spirochaetales bacterium]